MEGNYHEESSEVEISSRSSKRSYECVFCKRGFNTAQALGGHMNIHRKDRAKNKPNSNKHQEAARGSRLHHQQIPSSSSYNSHQDHHPQMNYHQPLNPLMVPGDWRMGLFFEISPTAIEDHHQDHKNINQEKDLDLELRLGYDS